MQPLNVVPRDHRSGLSATEAGQVLTLAERAGEVDGAPPLSEQFRLSVEARATAGVGHLLAYAADGALVGYAQCRSGSDGEPGSAELFVAPTARRHGAGSALLDALPPEVRLWSHGDGLGAEAFAAARGLRPVRALDLLGRSLVGGPAWPPPTLPEGYAVRSFERGRDEEAWLAVNAAAFATHPEQGSWARADLEQRMAQPWFDPEGFLLVVPVSAPDRIAAFHWTKVDPPDGHRGEVYVLGVSPEHQGRGLGRAATVLGLEHLRRRGLHDALLYVDEDNAAALRTYRSLGFAGLQAHRQYARSAPDPG
mgnify:CR=1 FL=1